MGWIYIFTRSVQPMRAQQSQELALHVLDMQWSYLSKTEVLLLFVGLRCRFGLRLARFFTTFGIQITSLSSITTDTLMTRCTARSRGILLGVELLRIPARVFLSMNEQTWRILFNGTRFHFSIKILDGALMDWINKKIKPKTTLLLETHHSAVLIFISTPLAVAHLGEPRTFWTGWYPHWTMSLDVAWWQFYTGMLAV